MSLADLIAVIGYDYLWGLLPLIIIFLAAEIVFGRSDAVFVMWIAGIFEDIIKTVKITLAINYRSKNAKI